MNKKKVKKVFKKVLYFILAVFVLFEFYYYSDFGKSRKLTTGEIEFLSTIYKDNIDYKKVNVYPRRFLFSPFQNLNTAMSPNGNIYFPEKYYSDDFSKENIYDQAWFIHESGHVFQYQTRGQFFSWEGAWLIFKNILFNHDQYKYEVNSDKDFYDYNMEQQADIFKNYFLYLNDNKILTEQEIEWYKKNIEFAFENK